MEGTKRLRDEKKSIMKICLRKGATNIDEHNN